MSPKKYVLILLEQKGACHSSLSCRGCPPGLCSDIKVRTDDLDSDIEKRRKDIYSHARNLALEYIQEGILTQEEVFELLI